MLKNISKVLIQFYFEFCEKNNTLKSKLEFYFSSTCAIYKKIIFFHKSWMKSLFYENNIVFNGFLRFWGFQKCAWWGFYHIWNWFNQNFENCVMVNSCEFGNILDFDIWLESHLVGFCIDFWSKFHLGTKSPMSGKKISHWSSVYVHQKSL